MWLARKKKSMQIIKLLLEKERMYQTEISELTGIKGGELVRRINELKEYGIIDWEIEDKFGGKKWIFLTPEGKEIAKHLIEIEKIMEKIVKKREER